MPLLTRRRGLWQRDVEGDLDGLPVILILFDDDLGALSWAAFLAFALGHDFDFAALIQDLIFVADDFICLLAQPLHLGLLDEAVEPDDFAWSGWGIEGVKHTGIDGGAGGSRRAWGEVRERAGE